jgi:hypothetical protein
MSLKLFDALRKRQKMVIAVLAVLSMFLFVIGDALMGTRSGGGSSLGYTVRRWFGDTTEEDLLQLQSRREMALRFASFVMQQGQHRYSQRAQQRQGADRQNPFDKQTQEADRAITRRIVLVQLLWERGGVWEPIPPQLAQLVLQNPGFNVRRSVDLAISNTTVNGVLEFRSLLKEADRLGIVVSPAKIREDLLKAAFGTIQDDELPNLLRGSRLSANADTLSKYLADEARAVIAREILQGPRRRDTGVELAVKVTPLDLWREFQVVLTSLPEVDFFEVEVERFRPLVKEQPDKEELKKFFDQYRLQDPPRRTDANADQPGFRVPARYNLDFVYIDIAKDKDEKTGAFKDGARQHYENLAVVHRMLPRLFAVTPDMVAFDGGIALQAGLFNPAWDVVHVLAEYERVKSAQFTPRDWFAVPLARRRLTPSPAVRLVTGLLPLGKGPVVEYVYYTPILPLYDETFSFRRDPQMGFGWDVVDVELANAAQYFLGMASLGGQPPMPPLSVVSAVFPSPHPIDQKGPPYVIHGPSRLGAGSAATVAVSAFQVFESLMPSFASLTIGTPHFPLLLARGGRTKPLAEVQAKLSERLNDELVTSIVAHDQNELLKHLNEYAKLYEKEYEAWRKLPPRQGQPTKFEPPKYGEKKEPFSEFAKRFAAERGWQYAGTNELRTHQEFLEEGKATPLRTLVLPIYGKMYAAVDPPPITSKHGQELETYNRRRDEAFVLALIGMKLKPPDKKEEGKPSFPEEVPYGLFDGRRLVEARKRQEVGDTTATADGAGEDSTRKVISWLVEKADPFAPKTMEELPRTAEDEKLGRDRVLWAWQREKARDLAKKHCEEWVAKFKAEFAKSGNLTDALRSLKDDPAFKHDTLIDDGYSIRRFKLSERKPTSPVQRPEPQFYTPEQVPYIADPPAAQRFFDQVFDALNDPGDTVILANRPKSRYYVLLQDKKRDVPTPQDFARIVMMAGELTPMRIGPENTLRDYVLIQKAIRYEETWRKYLRDTLDVDEATLKRLQEALTSNRRDSGE